MRFGHVPNTRQLHAQKAHFLQDYGAPTHAQTLWNASLAVPARRRRQLLTHPCSLLLTLQTRWRGGHCALWHLVAALALPWMPLPLTIDTLGELAVSACPVESSLMPNCKFQRARGPVTPLPMSTTSATQ